MNIGFKPSISGSIPQILVKYEGFNLMNPSVQLARLYDNVGMCLWVKEKLIDILFTFLTDKEKEKHDMVSLWTDCFSCDVYILI